MVTEPVSIRSRDYWFKVVEMLQQNWALIEAGSPGVMVYFVTDASTVFDEMAFDSEADAGAGLRRNGFRRFSEDPHAASFLRCPEPPFRRSPHPKRADLFIRPILDVGVISRNDSKPCRGCGFGPPEGRGFGAVADTFGDPSQMFIL